MGSTKHLRKPREHRKPGYGGETSRHACFRCRVCFHGTAVCPHCHQAMSYIGTHFRAPKRSNARAWNILERIGFSGSYRYGKGAVPASLGEVARHIQAKAQSCSELDQIKKQGMGLSWRAKPVYDSRRRYSGHMLMSAA